LDFAGVSLPRSKFLRFQITPEINMQSERKQSSHFKAFRKREWVGQVRRSHGAVARAASFEVLETRTLLSAYNPMNVRSAYGFDKVSFTDAGGGTVAGDGAGQTVAIVDAFDAPTLSTDVDYFDASWRLSRADNSSPTYLDAYGAASTFLTKATPSGTPSNDVGWSLETLLDVEWAHATAPKAKILLVEAKSASTADLMTAVDYARNQSGVSVVSMSWGSPEFAAQTTYDSHFTTPANHIGGYDASGNALLGGITFVAASGDTGAVINWPSVSPNVLAVGGTSLQINTSTFADSYVSESGWSGSGGGISVYEGKPSYQSGVTQSSTKRTTPDVAYDGDPNTGFYVRDTNGYSGWVAVGGTSAGSPQWASLIAVANQGRALSGNGSLDGASQTLPTLYSLGNGSFHDITTGSTAYRKSKFKATAGYDLVTGLGSPVPSALTQALLSPSSFGAAPAAAGAVMTAAPAVQPAATVTLASASLSPKSTPVSGRSAAGRFADSFINTAEHVVTGLIAPTSAGQSPAPLSLAADTMATAIAAQVEQINPSTSTQNNQAVLRQWASSTPSRFAPAEPLTVSSPLQAFFENGPSLATTASPAAIGEVAQAVFAQEANAPESSDLIRRSGRSLVPSFATAGLAILVGCWYITESRQRLQRRLPGWIGVRPDGHKFYADSDW
jgi:hypothetical protein